ncbi:hypothetical protein HAX54_009019 [Datura stramonium]|uniref:Malectin-like domain-containing protein n=1 Tax=Datura stramonium TaxID=4076 RepID=A0ABS8TFT0_DATST|nr:hypothetical protein [Datura stramonium]
MAFTCIPKDVTSPVIKEFLVPVNGPNLEIKFRPSQESSSAFVNAIEAFVTPQYFIPESSIHVTPQGNSTNQGLSSSGLTVIHRINVGGSEINPESDTMRRNWVPDDPYLLLAKLAKNHSVYSDRPNYVPEEGGATQYDAPDSVYKTAKEMNTSQSNNSFNITWLFGVNKNAAFFVRLHFCDIVSPSRNETVFNVYIYSLFGQPIIPYNTVPQSAAFMLILWWIQMLLVL